MQEMRHGFDPWIRKIPWRRKWQYSLQHSCLENPMDRGAWWSTVHRAAKSWTWLSNWAWWGDNSLKAQFTTYLSQETGCDTAPSTTWGSTKSVSGSRDRREGGSMKELLLWFLREGMGEAGLASLNIESNHLTFCSRIPGCRSGLLLSRSWFLMQGNWFGVSWLGTGPLDGLVHRKVPLRGELLTISRKQFILEGQVSL